jgi:peptidoglycan/xylan/chitin deacetylase (PgdA/CDA1 family)
LTWNQVREMERSGLVSFGGHTRTHPILSRVGLDTARQEIADCAADLEREIGPAPRHFAYPNGGPADFNEQVKGMVQEAGFASAVTSIRGTNGPGDDLFALRRITVDGTLSVGEVAAKASGLWFQLGQGGMYM